MQRSVPTRCRSRPRGPPRPVPLPETPTGGQTENGLNLWLDFMSDMLETGRHFRVFNVEDHLTREGLAAGVDTSLPGSRVARALDRIVAERGKPELIVSDNGTELTGNAMPKWVEENGVEWLTGGKLGSRSARLRTYGASAQDTSPSRSSGDT